MISIQMVTMIWIIQFRVHFPRISISRYRLNIYHEILHKNISPHSFFLHNIKWINWFKNKKRKKPPISIFLRLRKHKTSIGQLKRENVLNYHMVIFKKKLFFKIHVRIDAHLFFVCNRNNIYIFFTKKSTI